MAAKGMERRGKKVKLRKRRRKAKMFDENSEEVRDIGGVDESCC